MHAAVARRLAAAVLVFAAWLVAIGIVYAHDLRTYFPSADDWGLMAASQPGLAEPASWFRDGLSTWFQEDNLRSTSPYLRPVFNAGYWIAGLFADWDAPGRLWMSGVAVAAAAAALTWALSVLPGVSIGAAVLGGAALPLLPGYLPSLVMASPVLAFDPLCAAFCALALAAYLRQRWWTATLWLLLAVYVKEMSLPVALALPLHAAWARRQPAGTPPRAAVALLALPLLSWLLLRVAVSASFYGGPELAPAQGGWVSRLLQFFTRWPFWSQSAPWQLAPGLHRAFLFSLATVLANLTVVGVAAAGALRDLRRDGRVHVFDLAFLGGYAFMLLFGYAQRYASVLVLLMALNLAYATQTRRTGRWLALAAVMVAAVITGLGARHQWRQWEAQRDAALDASREYVRVLKAFPASARVLVLNDPSTCYSHLDALRRVAGVRAPAYKLADVTRSGRAARLAQACPVSLEEDVAAPRHLVFRQACGLDRCYSSASRGAPLDASVPDLVKATLRPASGGDAWSALDLELLRPDVDLVWYDPDTHSVHQRHVP